MFFTRLKMYNLVKKYLNKIEAAIFIQSHFTN